MLFALGFGGGGGGEFALGQKTTFYGFAPSNEYNTHNGRSFSYNGGQTFCEGTGQYKNRLLAQKMTEQHRHRGGEGS